MTTYTYAYKRKGMAGTQYARKAYPRRRNTSYNKSRSSYHSNVGADLAAAVITDLFNIFK